MIILVLFIIFSLIQISYWIFFHFAFSTIPTANSAKRDFQKPLSIIICFKNEYQNILQNLDAWISQVSPKDELILVNDFSVDASEMYIKEKIHQLSNIHLINATSDQPGKKQALIDGVKKASSKYILVTDADCAPPSNWKSEMAAHIDTDTSFVLGFAPFYKKKGFLNLFQRFENVLTALQYFSLAAAGDPYMGVGRNMIFSKEVFSEEIYKNQKLASGDDDLLASAKANSENTQLCLEPETFVYSSAAPTLAAFLRQKTRHISSSVEYKFRHKVLLGLFSSSQMMSNLLLVYLLFTCCYWFGISLFAIKLLTITFTVHKAGKKLKQTDLFPSAIFLDVTLTIYYLLLSTSFIFNNNSKWN